MDRENMTLVHDDSWGRSVSHRRGKISKVENGFIMKVMVSEPVKRSLGEEVADPSPRYVMAEKTYVFYTAEELLLALQNYLAAEKEEVRGEEE